MSASNIIVLSAGGTGGHLFPAQALAGELTRRGRYKQAYQPGTLREKMFGSGRARLAAPHPAALYRPKIAADRD